MVKIVKKSELKSFYSTSINEKRSNKEFLISKIEKDFKNLLKRIKPQKNINALDLGYGYGNYSIKLAKIGFKVEAIDYISPAYFKKRVKNSEISNRIKIIKKDIKSFVPTKKYYFIICKDVLHLLPKKKVIQLLKNLTHYTKKGGRHYLSIFVDIKREFKDGEKIVIKDEANFSKKDLIRTISNIYNKWDMQIKSKRMKELNHGGLKRPFNFYAKKLTIIASKN